MIVVFENSSQPIEMEVIDASILPDRSGKAVLLAEEDVNHPEYNGDEYRLYLGIVDPAGVVVIVDSRQVCDGHGYEKAANELLEKIQGIGAKLYQQAAEEESKSEDKKSDDKDEPVEGEVVEDDKK
jgi:hypothetical protein